MDIRRVLAGSLAALTAGAAMSFGIFAAGLGDYVPGATMPTIAVGDTAKVSDVVSAIDVGVAAAGYATTSQSVGGATVTSVTGGVQLDSDLNKTYLSQSFSTVRNTVTSSQLPELLKSRTFTDKNSTTITITQQIKPTTQSVAFGKPTGVTEGTLYIEYDVATANKYNTTIYFLGGLDTTAVDTDYSFTVFDNEYTFGNTVTTSTVELFTSSGAESITMTGAGDESTVNVGGTDYTFKLSGWNTGGTIAYLLINGAATTPAGWNEATYYTIPGTTIKVYVKAVDVIYTGAQEATGQVQLFVGADKLKFINGSAVQRNDVDLPSTMGRFSASASKINSITVETAPSVKTYLLDGGEFADPVFGFKWVLDGMTPGITDSSRDRVDVIEDGSAVKMTFSNKDGTEYIIPINYHDGSSWTGTMDGTNLLRIREGESTSGTFNITVGTYFVLTDASDKATYVYKFVSRGTTAPRYVSVQDVSTLTTQKVYYETDANIRIGASTFGLSNLTGSADTIIVDLDGDGTKTNATFVNIFTGGEAEINISETPDVYITEKPLYTLSGSNEPSNRTINISAAYSANDVNFGLTISGVSEYTTTGTYEKRSLTPYGTYVERDTNADTNSVYLPGNRPAYARVAVGSAPVFSETSGSTDVDVAVKVTAPVAKLASEVDTAALTGDLILVGGPCVNSLVKTLLDADWNVTDSCASWGDNVAGTGIIKEVADAFSSGQKALIVAGTTAADTRSLAAQVMTGTTAYPA